MRARALAIPAVALLLTASAPYVQQGDKLVGSGGNLANQGAVALSADGNTLILGGPDDHSSAGGAAWIFVRNGKTWSQQGEKLVGSPSTGADQGRSVGISADGNTVISGGWGDEANTGAAWIFTRSGESWSQQGPKLVGTGGTANGHQGWSVAISGDGNTALVGANTDDGGAGAAWVFTRSGFLWSQQGGKLTGPGAAGPAHFGNAVALSADGDTAIVGGVADASNAGAAWVFTRSGSVWSPQGPRLVGTGAVGAARQGASVAIASDGNTVLVGGLADASGAGAAWVFTRSGGAWSQQGNKLVGTGAVGAAGQGSAVGLSGNGNVAIVGGDQDDVGSGAVWVFARSGGAWSPLGGKLTATGAVNAAAQGATAAISGNASTIAIGGPNDATSGNYAVGAAWVFARVCGPSGRRPCIIAAVPPPAGRVERP